MYTSYWHLQQKPFECGADPHIYYPGEAHQAALLKLRYAIESRQGAALLAGETGCGKTLLVRILAQRLATEFTPFVHVVYPQMAPAELLSYLAGELGVGHEGRGERSVDDSVRRMGRLLLENTSQGKHAVLAIDEAHLLEGQQSLEALRLLLNFESHGHPALTLLLVGQPALLTLVDRLPHFDDRLGAKCLLRPLTLDETMSYVQHRLSVAGAKRGMFTAPALEAVHRHAQGQPRRINRLCDLALLVGFAEEQPVLNDAQIDAVARELTGVANEPARQAA